MGVTQICSVCLGGANSYDPTNPYSYEAFKKVPFFGPIGNYLSMLNIGGKGQGQQGGFMPNIGNLIGGSFFNNQGGPQGSIMPPMPQGMFDLSKLVNSLPIGSAKATDASIFDMIGSDNYVRKIKKSNYADLVKNLQSSQQKFTDPDFPPNQQSLGDLGKKGIDVSKLTWKRVPEIIQNPVFVKDKIQPSDILQGQLGDCYFLSALSALAQQDYRIKNLFPSLEINPHGIYMARMLHNGQYLQVVIDDYFPVDQNGKVFFANPAGGNEIWVMVLQKCWAKLYGSYAAIVGGLPNEVLHAFSSAPVFMKSIPTAPDRQEAIWAEMLENYNAGSLLCCGTKADAAIEAQGFVKGHAYTILGVFDKPCRLIKVRNPWGYKEWKGRASDYDTDFWNQMSPADKQRLNYEDASRNKDKDGVFFITWQDFLKYFQLIDFCKLNDNAHYNFIASQLNHLEAKLYQFQVRGDPGLVTFAVTQPNNRGTSVDTYSRSFLALGRWEEASKNYKYVRSNSDKKFADNYLQVKNAVSGKYMLYVKYLWSGGVSKNTAVVSVYSLSPATVSETQIIAPEDFLNQIFFDHAKTNPKKKNLNNTDWVCSDILLNDGGFSYFVANLEPPSTSKLGVTVQESDYTERRLVLQHPFRGIQQSRHEVNPGKPFVVVAQLLAESFPSTITNPTPTVVQLQ